MKTYFFVGSFLLALFLIIMGVLYGLNTWVCNNSWGDSGMPHRFKVFGGCQISTDAGKTWIPAERYRSVQ